MNQADQRAAILVALDTVTSTKCLMSSTEIADLLLQVANAPLHAELAAERLRADQGWARYENANQGHMQARAEIQYLNGHISELMAARPAPPTTSPYAIVSNWCQERAEVARATIDGVTVDRRKYEEVQAVALTYEAVANHCKRMLGEPALPHIPDELLQIGELLRTQNNRITDQPLFLVQRKRSHVTTADYSARFEWTESDGGECWPVSELRAKRLELLFQYGRDTSPYDRHDLIDYWEFVTACFTEQGCKDYLARDGHNLGEARIYADGSYRNHEYRVVRNWLMSLPPPSGVAGGAS